MATDIKISYINSNANTISYGYRVYDGEVTGKGKDAVYKRATLVESGVVNFQSASTKKYRDEKMLERLLKANPGKEQAWEALEKARKQ